RNATRRSKDRNAHLWYGQEASFRPSPSLDPIAHSLVGLHLARRPALRGLPAAPRLLLALSASLAPDVDRHLLAPFREALLPLGPAGILHSLPGAALTACLLAAVARPLVPAEGRRAAAVLA